MTSGALLFFWGIALHGRCLALPTREGRDIALAPTRAILTGADTERGTLIDLTGVYSSFLLLAYLAVW